MFLYLYNNWLFFISCFVLLGFFLAILQNKKSYSVLIIILFFLLAFADITALLITGEHIDLFCFFKVNFDIIKSGWKIIPDIFIYLVIFLLFLSFIIPIVFKISGLLLKLSKDKRKKVIIISFSICLPLFFISQTTIAYVNLVKQYMLYLFNKPENVFWNNNKYVVSKNIKAEKGKNLVIIYLESFENTFIENDKFKHLTPNMRHLAADASWYKYNNYNSCKGADNTSAALWATQTSFPAFFATDMFTKISQLKYLNINSWSNVLKAAGYKNVFISTDQINFGGKGHLLGFWGYEIKNNLIAFNNWKDTPWKSHDLDMFEAAKKEYLELLKNQPFNLTLLTVDIHFPRGYPDSRLEGIINIDKKESTKFALASTDYLVGDFINFIYQQPESENTVIVLLGDHDFKGNEIVNPFMIELRNLERKVLFMTNKKIDNYEKGSPIYFYDIPGIILNLLEVKNNATFSKDLIPEMSKEFVEKNIHLFADFNEMMATPFKNYINISENNLKQ